jgi:hypothetical protein
MLTMNPSSRFMIQELRSRYWAFLISIILYLHLPDALMNLYQDSRTLEKVKRIGNSYEKKVCDVFFLKVDCGKLSLSFS